MFSILCILCFYFVFVFYVLFIVLHTAISLLFLYKCTDHCHRLETQLQ
jgi:hypothetical protein